MERSLHVCLVQSLLRWSHYHTPPPADNQHCIVALQNNFSYKHNCRINIQPENHKHCLIILQQNDHLNGLGVVVNVDHPDPLVVEVLRLLREDHVGSAVAQLLLVYVEDSSLDFILEQKFLEIFGEFCLSDIVHFRRGSRSLVMQRFGH